MPARTADIPYTLLPPIPHGEREFPDTPEPEKAGVFPDGSSATSSAALLSDAMNEIRAQAPMEAGHTRDGSDRARRVLVSVLSLIWAGAATWLAIPWFIELGGTVTIPVAVLLIVLMAIVPSFLLARLLAALTFERPAPLRMGMKFPAVTVVVHCANDESTILDTLQAVLRCEYPGAARVMVACDGPTDATAELAQTFAEVDERIQVRVFPRGGRSRTLNAAVREVETPLVATVRAGTHVGPQSLKRLVGRLLSSSKETKAVAGALLAGNAGENTVTRTEEADRLLGVDAAMAQQGLIESNAVAHSDFALYRVDALRRVGGWPNREGEDVVLSWALLRCDGAISHEPSAVALTEAPEDLGGIARSRRPWAEGMAEGLRAYGNALVARKGKHSEAVFPTYSFPYVDMVYGLALPLGIVFSWLGSDALLLAVALLCLPLTLLVSGVASHRSRKALAETGIELPGEIRAFLVYQLVYPLVLGPVAFWVYLREVARSVRPRRRVKVPDEPIEGSVGPNAPLFRLGPR